MLPAGDGRPPRRPRPACVPCPDSRDHVSMSPTREQDGGPCVSRRLTTLATRLRRRDANTTRLRRCETDTYDTIDDCDTNYSLTSACDKSRIQTFINELFGPPETVKLYELFRHTSKHELFTNIAGPPGRMRGNRCERITVNTRVSECRIFRRCGECSQ